MTSLNTRLCVDAHVHLYPQYDLRQALENGLQNLRSLSDKLFGYASEGGDGRSGDLTPVLVLAERSDCDFFRLSRKLNQTILENGFRLVPADEKETIIVEQAGNPVLYILAGRQIVTKEGLEILSLTSTLFLQDRQKNIDEVVKAVNDSGGVAALNWAPGKWFFSRGKVVKRVLEEYRPGDLALCDTSLRNTFWATPKLMSIGRKRGFKIIAGSDPLPFKGEEKYVGSYGCCLTGRFDPNSPAHSLRSLVKKDGIDISFIGKRNGLFTFFKRETMIMLEKKKGN